MLNEIINKHIEKMHSNWLEKSSFFCHQYGLQGEAEDVLQETLMYILEKDPKELLYLTLKKEEKYQALDCYVIRTLELNISSVTAPYRRKYFHHTPTIDRNAEIDTFEITEEEISSDNLKLIHTIYNHLNLPVLHREIFEFIFFQSHTYDQWKGSVSRSTAVRICHSIIRKIQKKLKKLEKNGII